MLAYLIFAHKNPSQLSRLVSRISSNKCFIYIHLDVNSNLADFEKELSTKKLKSNWIIFQSFECPWGDNNMVKATIEALNRIIKTEINFSHVILLSGQDYPLHTQNYILQFFSDNMDVNFINMQKCLSDHRLKYYKINYSKERYDFHLVPTIFDRTFYSSKNLFEIIKLIKSKKRKALFKIMKTRDLPFCSYRGEVWWALNLTTIKLILSFIENHPFFLEFHNDTLSSDEFFFHTILSQIQSENDLKIQNTLTYTNWNKKNETNPKTFKHSDLSELLKAKSKFLFARKFDEFKDIEILNSLDIQT